MQIKLAGFVVAAAGVFLGSSTGHVQQSPEIPVDVARASAHVISARQAAEYTRNFRATRATLYGQHADLKGRFSIPESESFNRDAIAALLNAKDASGNPAAGVRVYWGLDSAGQTRLVLVPYDGRGKDILTTLAPPESGAPVSGAALVGTEEAIEDGQRCPPYCADEDSLLSGN